MDSETETRIREIFDSIKFSQKENIKLFEKWKRLSLNPLNSSGLQSQLEFSIAAKRVLPWNQNHGYQGTTDHHSQFLDSRRKLLSQLENLQTVLSSEGEESAARLLRQYNQILSPGLKIFIIFLIVAAIAVFLKTMDMMGSPQSEQQFKPETVDPFLDLKEQIDKQNSQSQ
ncbi:MAG: hypothetical protein ACK5V3_11785 [Bdellovibrionales bacterium]